MISDCICRFSSATRRSRCRRNCRRSASRSRTERPLLRDATGTAAGFDNETLTRVGPGTPMGNLLRRYWIPACLSSEIGQPDGAPARVRLLGEDLVAFRDTRGAVGLIEERCPHCAGSLGALGRSWPLGIA